MNWTSDYLNELATTIDYGLTASATDNPVGPKFLRITDIQNGKVNWNSVPFCKPSEKEQSRYKLAPGDIVFARTGATTGKSFLIDECPANSVFASYLIRVRPSERLNPRFLYHYFQTDDYWKQIASRSSGTAQPGVNASKLANLRIPLPPLEEQRWIAEVLDRADALRQKRRIAIRKLDALLQSVFLDMFGDPIINPRGWRTVPLRSTATVFSDGPFGSNLKSSHYQNDGVRVIRLNNIGIGKFVDKDKAFISEEHFASLPRNHCKPGDVVVATLGEPNLRAIVVPSWLNRALNKADCVLLRPDVTVADANYLVALLNTSSINQAASGLSLGQTRLRISMGRLSGLQIPLPPLEMQNKYSMFVENHRGLMAKYYKLSSGNDNLFDALQQRAFKGELFQENQ